LLNGGTAALLAVVHAAVLVVFIPPHSARASDVEEEARLSRRGAGLRIGTWQVEGLEKIAAGEYAESPAFEGYFQKGLDLHLAIETTLGMWRRTQELEDSGGLGISTRERVRSYVIPATTAIKFFPLTRPDDPFEPYLSGGIGFAFGIDDRETETTLVGGGSSSSGDTAFLGGFGFRIGTGADWWFSNAFGLTGGSRYSWIRFGQEVGGEDTYKGFAFDAGLTYRFQYE
jgi:hypothetical protein